jgi:hypothetical protein
MVWWGGPPIFSRVSHTHAVVEYRVYIYIYTPYKPHSACMLHSSLCVLQPRFAWGAREKRPPPNQNKRTIVLVLVARTRYTYTHTLSVCVCVCMRVCVGSLSSKASDVPPAQKTEDQQQARSYTHLYIYIYIYIYINIKSGVRESCCEAAVRDGRSKYVHSRARTFPSRDMYMCIGRRAAPNNCATRILHDAHHWRAAAHPPRTHTHAYTHTRIYIYIYIYRCVYESACERERNAMTAC